MSLKQELVEGTLGIRLSPPDSFRVIADDAENLRCIDDERLIEWRLFFERDQRMDLDETHRDHLQRYMEWIGREMFDQVFEQYLANAERAEPQDGESSPLLPHRRTEDASWSPIIEAASIKIDEASAFQHIHRMAYMPGREIIMGHLLVPLPKGLFEARVIAMDQMTGYRESTVLMTQMNRDPERFEQNPFGGLRQADYDDPQYDEAFAKHCLSRVRGALRSLRDTWKLEVREQAPALPPGEQEIPELRCAIVPPARFILDPTRGPGAFRRVSFCNTDGIDYFFVERHRGAKSVRPPQLAAEAENRTRLRLAQDDVKESRVTVQERPAIAGRPQVLVLTDGMGHRGALRNAFHWFLDDRGELWSLVLAGNSPAIPSDAMAAELEEAARSWRSLPGRPWWKVW